MSAYKYMSEAWRRLERVSLGEAMKEKIIRWRREPSIVRVDKPTRIDKARRYGYKAKQGFVVVRVKVRRGGARKTRPKSGRRQKALGVVDFTRRISLKRLAQARAARKFSNLLPLNTYWLWEDGKHVWFEVVMVDPSHPVIKSDKSISKVEPVRA
ncbi:MAG: 50S ribosomal protein L15e [Candidatus Bathyarchaeia archaeon]